MNEHMILNGTGMATMAFAAICGVLRLRSMDRGGKLILLLIVLGLLTEAVATWAGIYYRNNMPVYAVFNVVEVVLVSLFYDESLDLFRRRRAGRVIAALAVLLWIANLLWLQSIKVSNSNFMILGGVYIIVFSSLAAFRDQLDEPEQHRLHFWLNLVLLFYWGISLLTWFLYDDMVRFLGKGSRYPMLTIHIINWLTNLSFSAVFLFTPKTKHYE